jgi:hypothetical protein
MNQVTRNGHATSSRYRIVAWRIYADRQGNEQATMSLHRDEIDPALKPMTRLRRHAARTARH